MKDIQGRTFWIIGASSGIGRAVAKALHNKGAKLVLSARNEDDLKVLNQELDNAHNVQPLDISDFEATQKIVNSLSALDSVLNFAAIYAPHGEEKPIEFVHQMNDVNINGIFNSVYAVRPIFEKQRYGQIVLCGSVAGYRGLPTGQPYCAAKAAIISYAESLYVELKPKNIDVKLISPGFVKTRLTDKNDFDMPFIIEAEEAAKRIVNGLTRNAFEIHFPKRMTLIMKGLRLLPNALYFKIAEHMMKETKL